MRLRHAVFARRIAGIALFGDDLPLTGQAALQPRLDFLTALLFERIGASAGDQHAADRE